MPSSPLPPDPYKVLGVAKDAPIASIRSAYRKLVLISHPDKFPDEVIKAQKAEEFHRVQQAYEILSDDKARERYDAQVRLAELKAERFREAERSREEASTPPRRQDPPYSPRPSVERAWTSQPIVEEIRPRTRHYDEYPTPPPSRPEPRWEERRQRTRDYDDLDDFIPAHGATRKGGSTKLSEARVDDAPNRPRTRLRAGIAKAVNAERAKEKEIEDRRRNRDKGRRDDGQSKRHHNRSSIGGESDSDMDSDVEYFMSNKKESSRSFEEERHHSRRKHESRASSPDRETKYNSSIWQATQHILKTTAHVSGRSRGQSGSQLVPPAPPPPPAPVPGLVDEPVRSSARRNATSKSSKSSKREPVEIVEPPSRRRDHDVEVRVPDLKASVTSPTMSKPSRSATMDTRTSERSPRTTMKRSATTPLPPSAPASHSQKSSKLGRDTHDSGYSSPDNHGSRSKTTSYRVTHVESASDSEGPHFVVIGPEARRPQVAREQSMHTSTSSHRSERVSAGTGSTRHGTVRSHTDDHPSYPHRPATLARGATDRPGLYGEIPRASPEPRIPYPKVHESPRYGKDDIHYSAPYHKRAADIDSRNDHHAAYSRRGSVPIRSGRA